MTWLADLHRKHPRIVAALVVGLTLAAAAGIPRLDFEDDPRAIFRVNSAEFDALEEFYADFGPDDQDVLLVIEGENLFSAPAIAALHGLSDELAQRPDVTSVVGLRDVRQRGPVPLSLIPAGDSTPDRRERARRQSLAHPLAAGQFLSADGATTVVSVRLAGTDLSVSQLEPAVRELREAARRHLELAGLRFRLAGHPPTRIDLLRTLRSEFVKFAILGILVSGAIAMAVFRTLPAVLIASTGPAIGALWTLGAMAWLGVKIDPFSVVLPMLLFVVGFTDAVHLIADMRASEARGLDRRAAAAAAVEHLGPACLITALTTMFGFASLAVAHTDSIQRFGLNCAAGTMVMLCAVQLVVPLLAATRLGDRLSTARSPGLEMSVAWLEPAYRWLLGRPRWVATVSILVTLGCFLTSLQLRSDLRWMESLPADSETAEVTRHCDEAFGGALFGYVVVEWPEKYDLHSAPVLAALEDVHTACAEVKTLRGPLSVLTVLESLKRGDESLADQVHYLDRMPPELLDRFFRPAQRKAAVSVHVPDVGAAQLAPDFAKLEDRLAELEQKHPGIRMRLTGTVVVAARNVYQIIADLAWSMTLASVVIFAMMTMLFRSLYLGLLSVIPNMFPQAITASLLVWAGQPLEMTSVLTFSICLGLSVDDTVHFLMRFREERSRGGTLREVVFRTFQSVGGVMLATSLVLIGGFLVMLASRMPGIRTFATLSSATLVSALLGDLVMLPGLLLCFSRTAARRS